MDRTYLVYSLIFENENTFEKCSKEECKNILDISWGMSLKNKNIKNALIKHKVQDLFNKYDKNILQYIFAKQKDDRNKMQECIDYEFEIINIVKSDKEINDIFLNLLIAEYKEYIYGSIFYPHFDKYEFEIMDNYLESIEQHFTEDGNSEELLRNHTHNPKHFMFDDGKHYYMFHEMIESKGTKIIDYEEDEYEDDNDY